MNTQRAVSQDIDKRIRPTVAQAGANVTLEDCEDTTVVYLPCEERRRKPNTRLRFSQRNNAGQEEGFVISVTKWMRTRLSSLVISVTSSRTFLFSSCTRMVRKASLDAK